MNRIYVVCSFHISDFDRFIGSWLSCLTRGFLFLNIPLLDLLRAHEHRHWRDRGEHAASPHCHCRTWVLGVADANGQRIAGNKVLGGQSVEFIAFKFPVHGWIVTDRLTSFFLTGLAEISILDCVTRTSSESSIHNL